ncbi:MAG: hypothetical protein JWQ96_2682 [Segetibacter sp.]|nr:hypothetical protein [Segetibacter sp.]
MPHKNKLQKSTPAKINKSRKKFWAGHYYYYDASVASHSCAGVLTAALFVHL